MVILVLGCSNLMPGGADSPAALQTKIEDTLAAHERWRVIDYVQPEDRDVFLAELELSAGFAKIAGGSEADAELDAINAGFGVPKHDWPRQDPVAYTAAIERVYAGVTDPRGLAEALVSFQQRYAPGSVAPPGPRLNEAHTSLIFGTKECPIVAVDGRFFIDLPDPATRTASTRPPTPTVSDPFEAWDLDAIAARFDGGTWRVHGRWPDPVQVWSFTGSTVRVVAGDRARTLTYTVTSPCKMRLEGLPSDPHGDTGAMEAYFAWDGPSLQLDSAEMGYRDHGAIVACGPRGTLVLEEGRCGLWSAGFGASWRSSPATCAVTPFGFRAESELGETELAFSGEALVNARYAVDGGNARFAAVPSAGRVLRR